MSEKHSGLRPFGEEHQLGRRTFEMMVTRLFLVGLLTLNFGIELVIAQDSGAGTQGGIQKDDSLSSEALMKEGINQINQLNYDEALHLLERAIKIDSSNWMAYRQKGIAEGHFFGFDRAIPTYTKAIELHEKYEKDTISYLLRGEAYHMVGNWLNSVADENRVIELISADKNPILVKAHYWRAGAYHFLELYDKAVEDWSFVLKNSGANDVEKSAFGPVFQANVLFFRGRDYGNMHLYRKAIEDITKYLNTQDVKYAYFIRGSSYLGLVTYEDVPRHEILKYADSAISDFKSYIPYGSVKDLPRSFTRLGMAYAIKGDSLNSKEYFQKGQELDPAQIPTENILGDIELNVNKDYRKAVDHYRKVLETNWKPTPLFYQNLARAKINLSDTLGTLNAFEKAIQLDSNSIELYMARGSLLSAIEHNGGQQKSFDSLGIHDISELIRLFHDDSLQISKLYTERATLYSRNTNFAERALEDLTMAIAYNPHSAYTYLERAVFQFGSGATSKKKEIGDRILMDLDSAISIDEKLWECYIIKAFVLRELKNLEKESCHCVKLAIKFGGKVPRPLKRYLCNNKVPKSPKFDYMLYPGLN